MMKWQWKNGQWHKLVLGQVTQDPSCNMGYVDLGVRKKGRARTLQVYEHGVQRGGLLFNLDVDETGRLLGIECFQAETQLGKAPKRSTKASQRRPPRT